MFLQLKVALELWILAYNNLTKSSTLQQAGFNVAQVRVLINVYIHMFSNNSSLMDYSDIVP